ncbi:hypothetical protein F7725_009448 [Dissostichus mawsoni]|uniref:Uncharacterized protein n=1 Tax=Dissostichus mawsoni TaxID=36200 RepID=A0A7J5XL05_DISMA|nr:hypothetical protein F7725_009448 [Dissostichus mawsoni]
MAPLPGLESVLQRLDATVHHISYCLVSCLDSADTMRSVLQEIRDFRAEHKVDLNKLKEEIKRDMKSELEDMKQEMYQKLSANSALTQAHETRLEEVEKRIDEVETVNMAMSDALIKSMK